MFVDIRTVVCGFPWNGYFWAKMMMTRSHNEWPLQVYIRDFFDTYLRDTDSIRITPNPYADASIMYAMVVCAIIPILIIYPYIQKYFAKGVTMGGVKE